MRSDLPAGTVTFLITDVEGSTKLRHALGAAERSAEPTVEPDALAKGPGAP